ncbi:MAG TPA: tRNA (adenosine(37)-N6)-threonylcarbamoyltransferase complex transferase subunit TsaD [Candidatus Paceibacterota bacterium]|nr:tRNA (adenosine(37)-N6)-threonylcarbamoyltransferase complex transferase subunit TsaD [Candidatus Paceibacterota bacterium]
MKLLAIETSCDETAVSVLDGTAGEGTSAHFTLLGNALLSQIDIHKEYGGVYPMIAKREHAKNLVPLLGSALEQAGMYRKTAIELNSDLQNDITQILEREPGLTDAMLVFLSGVERPEIDAIAVTAGPGLEPALWVGVNFAKALARAWNLPIISVNHMEGHICAALAQLEDPQHISIPNIELPLLSLLISGGHTELVLSKEWGSFELVGATRDDAVGEAFDKVARMLGLPYPGGPEVSKLAERTREAGRDSGYSLPRPMINDAHCDFSFSGLKTAVLYQVKDANLTDEQKEDMAREFEDAVADVLYSKTKRALEETGAKTLALGGGVSANTHIQRSFRIRLAEDFPDVHLAIPVPALTTDNAIMIGLVGFYHAQKQDFADADVLRADGNRKLRA